MNSQEIAATESRRQPLLEHLTAAEAALRINLHALGLDRVAREHRERALAHVREAHVALNEIGHARSVQELTNDLVRVQEAMEKGQKWQISPHVTYV